MKKLCFLLAILLLLTGCSGEPVPTQPTTIEPLPSGSTAPTVPTTTAPAEQSFMIPDEFSHCEIVAPEDGVLILHGEETIQDKIIVGDVYITVNGKVAFSDVMVVGDVYCHGKLTTTGYFRGKHAYSYKSERLVCGAYDGIHGEINRKGMSSISPVVNENALDYAFETWGKVELTGQPPTEIRMEGAGPSIYDPAQVRILSGEQTLVCESINGDVYITSDGDITFCDVTVNGNLYVYGKINLIDYASIQNRINGYIYAYDFGVTCEAFDGTHGQVTGGPVWCNGYVVANDALDYAFDTWGKQ